MENFSSASILRSCCLDARSLSLEMVGKLEEEKKPFTFLAFTRAFSSLAASSFPITPCKETFDPRDEIFDATFAAPPNLLSSDSGLKTGTGASGETLSTLP